MTTTGINTSKLTLRASRGVRTFLKTHRALLQPEDVGIPRRDGRRNTPGLRRARKWRQISGVGLTWYTWLEQGRQITASEHVVDALARALHLDRQSHRHFRRLAGLPVPDSELPTGDLLPEHRRLLDSVFPAPATSLDLHSTMSHGTTRMLGFGRLANKRKGIATHCGLH